MAFPGYLHLDFVIFSSFDVSGGQCLVIMTFPGYLHSDFCHFFFFRCLGRTVLNDYGISCVSSLRFLSFFFLLLPRGGQCLVIVAFPGYFHLDFYHSFFFRCLRRTVLSDYGISLVSSLRFCHSFFFRCLRRTVLSDYGIIS